MLSLLVMGVMAAVTGEPDKLAAPTAAYERLLREFPKGASEYSNGPKEQTRAIAERFFSLAREHREAPEALKALGWIATHCLYSESAARAMGWIARDHARSPDLAPVLSEIERMYGDPFAPNEAMLRVVEKGSPFSVVRATAAYCLARELAAKRDQAERHAVQHDQFMAGAKVPFVEKPDATAADLERWWDEAAALCDSIMDEPTNPAPLRADAEGLLQAIRTLNVGQRAPEIEGRDHEGKLFRLSDSTGKVVVLMFTTSWCAPCKATYPVLRGLIERNRDRPFAVLSVYADPDTGSLRKAVDSREITWRCWCDGGPEGPISKRWNVSGYPTIYVLDRSGTIRHKQPVGVEAVVEDLLKQNAHD